MYVPRCGRAVRVHAMGCKPEKMLEATLPANLNFKSLNGTFWNVLGSERGMDIEENWQTPSFATMRSPRLATTSGLTGIRGNTDECRQRFPVPRVRTIGKRGLREGSVPYAEQAFSQTLLTDREPRQSTLRQSLEQSQPGDLN
jgi:hypothetical protein